MPKTAIGEVISARDFRYEAVGPCSVAAVVGPRIGAETVMLDVVRLPAGESWAPADAAAEENIAVVAAGSGTATVAEETTLVRPASALHAPTGLRYTVRAEEDITLYVWRSPLLPGRRGGAAPKRFSTLWADQTQLRGFTGIGDVTATAEVATGDTQMATMNFVFWPGTGSAQLCLHCGIQEPGQTFNVHVHPDSDEAFFVFEGVGQVYLADRWVDVEVGDVLFARPGVPHGARNPATGPTARRYVTCGGPTPFDPALYRRAGVSAEVK